MQCKCGGDMSAWRYNKDGTRIAKCSGCTRVVKHWDTTSWALLGEQTEPPPELPRQQSQRSE